MNVYKFTHLKGGVFISAGPVSYSIINFHLVNHNKSFIPDTNLIDVTPLYTQTFTCVEGDSAKEMGLKRNSFGELVLRVGDRN